MKILLTLCIALFITTSIYAKLPIGVKIGANGASLINLPDGANNTAKMSFYSGLFTSIEIGGRFSLQPELIYSRQGAELNPNRLFPSESEELISLGQIDRKIRLNYINIPIVINYNVWGDLSINLAPQLGINLNGRDKIVYASAPTVKKNLYGIKRCDLSIGVGLEYLIWPKLDVTVRYNIGLTNIVKRTSEFANHNIKNGVLQIGLGLVIF